MALGAFVDEDRSDLFVEGHLVISVRRSSRCQYARASEEMGAEGFGVGAIHGLSVWMCGKAVHARYGVVYTYTPFGAVVLQKNAQV